MIKFTSLIEWLTFLETQAYHLTPEQQFVYAAEMARRLNLKKIARYTIVVTGTNGKGSVVACLEKLAAIDPIKIGVITSPHLLSFNERIKINDEPVSDELICQAFEKIFTARGTLPISYIQYVYLAGLLILKEADVDLAILEVGMGGRLDVMNTVENDLTIITNVDYDHCEKLGFTREAIGAEKAALIRPHTAVVMGDENCPSTVYDEAVRKSATLYCQQKDYFYTEQNDQWSWKNQQLHYENLAKPSILLCNASTALQAYALYKKQNINQEKINAVLANLFVAGRCQLVQKECDWLLDVAHNPQAVENLTKHLQKLSLPGRKVYAVFGICSDKDIEGCLQAIKHVVDEWFVCRLPTLRSANRGRINEIFQLLKIENFDYYDEPKLAYQAVKQKAQAQDLVLTFGSFVTVSHVLKYLSEGE